MTRRTVPRLLALALALYVSLCPDDARAEHGCGDFGSLGVVLASSGAFLAGTAGAATSAGMLAAGNEEKDFSFLQGFGFGELGVAIYSVGYLALDNALGCAIVDDADGYPWGVIVGGALVGALVPLIVYAGSDSTPQASSNLALRLTF
ncbi:MAG: hypothetical protein R3B07_02755 [Polyangiaceae bacterium]